MVGGALSNAFMERKEIQPELGAGPQGRFTAGHAVHIQLLNPEEK